jgi:hypothetical protein
VVVPPLEFMEKALVGGSEALLGGVICGDPVCGGDSGARGAGGAKGVQPCSPTLYPMSTLSNISWFSLFCCPFSDPTRE